MARRFGTLTLGVTFLGLDRTKLAHQWVADGMSTWALAQLPPFASPGSQKTRAGVTVVGNPVPYSLKFYNPLSLGQML